MARFLVFAQSPATAAALEAARKRLRAGMMDSEEVPRSIIISPESLEVSRSCVDLFTACADAMEGTLTPAGSSVETVALVDAIRPPKLNATSESASWDHLIAMLILAFPEVRWVFGVIQGEDPGLFASHHSLSELVAGRERDPLFDPTGLREWVRRRTMANLKESGFADQDSEWLPERRKLAASIDDEKSYAYYHAYAAYRYGFRADVVTTWIGMKMLFGSTCSGERHALLLEDMRLNFADKPASVHLSDLVERGRLCPALDVKSDGADWRFLISTGQTHGDNAAVAVNRELLETRSRGRGDVLWKPVGGLIDLWERTGLMDELGGGKQRSGNADDFNWPLPVSDTQEGKGHAAPGKLLLIAEVLLRRAEVLASGPASVVGAIRAALNATEGIEISTGRTPTTAVSGIVVRQEVEVKAECAFIGAGFHTGISRRLQELDAELKNVTAWFHVEIRKKAALDARVSTLSRLVLVFRNAGKVEEETACLNALRTSNRQLSRPIATGITLEAAQRWMRHFFLGYSEWVMGSLERLVVVSVFWLVLLSLAARALSPLLPKPIDLPGAAAQAASWFLGTSPLTDWSALTPLSWFGAALGVFHLGLLISYLYSLVARK